MVRASDSLGGRKPARDVNLCKGFPYNNMRDALCLSRGSHGSSAGLSNGNSESEKTQSSRQNETKYCWRQLVDPQTAIATRVATQRPFSPKISSSCQVNGYVLARGFAPRIIARSRAARARALWRVAVGEIGRVRRPYAACGRRCAITCVSHFSIRRSS
jgi:hypothetical protein